ncbi:scavenger receptor class B member 1-like, partial [Tropilaelaps mercedesae]
MELTPVRIAVFFSIALFVAICFGAYPLVPDVIRAIARTRLALVPGSATADQSKALPVNITQRVYMFNITNYSAFMDKGAVPNVRQLGPYTFASEWVKNLSWNGDQLLFRENRTFYFLPDLSNGTLDDEIVTVDLVVVGAIQMVDKLPERIQKFIRPLLDLRPILCKHKVREFLYEG